ncbi:hypothetical protein PAXRUDRAFT_441928 [Paxillus rubicundulus Ve08.2h10]|uniref:Unplaced genomic scaffold scaffold_277, whole genome shotgun sequence n=1 Tax=Paxillus rubicundulus Ve08.2h10 TaxID=930991 RepID=A0A0D0DBJ1_9AGAM|nr:hypothetical protein PAXRUDRAFT_441928 [Paxillus rubicundulus Ve08.2h10]
MFLDHKTRADQPLDSRHLPRGSLRAVSNLRSLRPCIASAALLFLTSIGNPGTAFEKSELNGQAVATSRRCGRHGEFIPSFDGPRFRVDARYLLPYCRSWHTGDGVT